jgi:hypothetical protein
VRILFLSLLISLPTWAAETAMVFMRETSQGKHVVLKQNNTETVLTHGKNWHLYPDISADGKWVTWVEGASQRNLSVVLYNVQNKSREKWELARKGQTLHPRLTKNGETIFFSAPTVNGNKIVYFKPDQSRGRIDRQEADGTRVYRITALNVTHQGQGFFPQPSADGSFVVFQRNLFNRREIVEYNFITKTTRVLAEGMSPALSPDESFVLFTSKVQGSWDIWIANRQDGNSAALTNDPKDEMAPTFTKDNEVVFASNKSGRFQVYKIINNGDWTQLTESASADDYAPQFSGEIAWKQSTEPSFPAPARSSFGSVEHLGKIYICAGHQGAEHTYPPESFTDYLQVYDPNTQVWTELAPRPHKAHGFQMAAHGNYLYAFGGFAYEGNNLPKWKSIDVIDRYDITTNTWETIGKMPRNRSSNAAVTVNGKVYLIGGWDSTPNSPGDLEGHFHSAIDVFDLETETISQASWSIPLPLRRAFTAVENNGTIILVGGLGVGSSHFELLGNVTLIEPVSGYTRELPPLPFPTFAPAAGILNNELLVFGGMFKTGPMNYEYVSHIYGMNLASEKWRHTGRFLKETKGFSQVTPFAQGLAILGGHRYFENRDEPVQTFEVIQK